MNKARVFWELNWDGKERTRKAAFAEARRLMRTGKQVVLYQVWVWKPRPGFPNGKRIEVGRWYCPMITLDEAMCQTPWHPRLQCDRRAWEMGEHRPYQQYRRWRPSYNAWM